MRFYSNEKVTFLIEYVFLERDILFYSEEENFTVLLVPVLEKNSNHGRLPDGREGRLFPQYSSHCSELLKYNQYYINICASHTCLK